MPKKVSELTKELDISLQELKGYADKLGIAVGSSRTSLEDADAERLLRSVNALKGNTTGASAGSGKPRIKGVPVMPKDRPKAKPPVGKHVIPKKAVVPKEEAEAEAKEKEAASEAPAEEKTEAAAVKAAEAEKAEKAEKAAAPEKAEAKAEEPAKEAAAVSDAPKEAEAEKNKEKS